MIKSGLKAAAILATILWANTASADPLTCEAVVRSPQGGRVVMARIDPVTASTGLPIVPPGGVSAQWYPPSSSNAVAIEIEFNGQTLESLQLFDMNAEIVEAEGLDPDQFTARLSGDTVPTVKLEMAGVNVVTRQYVLSFNWTHAEDRALAQALAKGTRVKVDIFRSDKGVAPEMFNGTLMKLVVAEPAQPVASAMIDTTALEAREALFAQARHLIETSDPAVCKPVSSLVPTGHN